MKNKTEIPDNISSSEILIPLVEAGKKMSREDIILQRKSYVASKVGADEDEDARKMVDKYFKENYGV
ncbi:MAG: hypothetical protein OXD43_05420 [Bacteroidetes bacterium]|nr:hypothetical protein [Bacteroidota bacterium]